MTRTEAVAPPTSALRGGLPDPGEQVPWIAVPTVGLLVGCLTLWGLTTWAALGAGLSPWIYVPVLSAISFAMFTVLHDAVHHSISRHRWVNAVSGRIAIAFFVPYASAPLFGFVHIEHHRYTNESPDLDPDKWIIDGSRWLAPLRWLTLDVAYLRFYFKKIRTRSGKELAESALIAGLFVAGIVIAALSGTLWAVALLYLIPTRIALGFLVWWFGYLPHHGLEATQRENRYRATRVRVGMEWLLTPILLYQNYHLVHHLHPSIPFYRYIAAWKRNEDAYLERDAAITTAFGRDLTPDEYRAWRSVQPGPARSVVETPPVGSSAGHATFHRLTVSSVERLTPDSVAITFAVPRELADAFRFEAGQHVIVRSTDADSGGDGVRRNYSICSPATGDTLKIAVKRIPGGAFSSYATTTLKAGDQLDVMTPTGRFGPALDPTRRRHYVAVAAGSGITPIMSILATALQVESESRFTLVYGNRTPGSTMFGNELAELESRFADRLEIVHRFSGARAGGAAHRGRIDEKFLRSLLDSRLSCRAVDDWFLCGPPGLIETVRAELFDRGVDAERIHAELFHVSPVTRTSSPGTHGSATIRLGGRESALRLAPGESVLDGALRLFGDTPYACMGGACGTCRAKVVSGTAHMDHNYALTQADLRAGYVLTCQAVPQSPDIVVDYDS